MQTSPNRPVAGNAPLRLPPAHQGWKHTLLVVLGILMFGGMLAAACIFTAPALVSDWQIHAAAQPVAGARVTDGKCDTTLIFNICDVTLVVPNGTGRATRRVNYVFTGVHFGDYQARVVADPARPGLPTTDMALDRLWNRTLTLAIVSAILLALTLLPLAALVRRRRPNRAAAS